MRGISKLTALQFITLSTTVIGQFPFFLRAFRPVRHGLLSSGSSPYSFLRPSSFFSALSSSSAVSPVYGSPNPFFGNSISGSSPLGSLNFHSSPSFGPSLGAPSFSSPNLGALLASSSFGSSPSFESSPFASASLHSPAIGTSDIGSHKFGASSLGSSSLLDLGSENTFDSLGAFDQSELLGDYPGFSNADFGKDLNFAGSQPIRFQAPSSFTDYDFLKRSEDKN